MVSYIPIERLKCNANQIKIQSCGIFSVPRKPDTLIVYVQLQYYIGQRIDDWKEIVQMIPNLDFIFPISIAVTSRLYWMYHQPNYSLAPSVGKENCTGKLIQWSWKLNLFFGKNIIKPI